MAIYVAQEAFQFFGTSYSAGATIDTTGWPQHRVDQLVEHHPVALQGTAGAAGPTGPQGPAGTTGATGSQGPAGVGVNSPETVNAQAAVTGAYTVPDMATATAHRLTLTGNATFTFPTAAAGKSFTISLVQDATGSRTVTWPANVKWSGGTAPTLTTAANKSDVFSFLCLDGTNWLGFVSGQNF